MLFSNFCVCVVCGGLNALLIYIQMLSEASFKKISLVS